MSWSRILKEGKAGNYSVSTYMVRDMTPQEQEQAEDKVEEARQQAEAIIREAKARRESLEMEAYNEGMAKGQEEGRRIVTKKIEPLFDTLKNAIDELVSVRESLVETHGRQILEMIFLIAEKIIHRSIQLSPDIVLDTVRAASRYLMETDEIHLHLHPSDFEYIREIEALLAKKLTGRKAFHIVEDSTLDRGGVIIKTEFGVIDASIRSQIDHLREAILDHE
ncbi:MAG: FliH/SctL family protein [Desulfomonilia bacterium]|jgi:flagellar assembly protein FliH